MPHSLEPIARSTQDRLVAYGQICNQGKTQRIVVTLDGEIISWHQTIVLWQKDVEFRALTTQILRDSPYTAFFWETPPLTPTSFDQPWEFVLVQAPMLAKVLPNPQPFATYLENGNDNAPTRVFPNLGGDALLVVPCALGPLPIYTHLANFVRQASAKQVDHLWKTLGDTVQGMVGDGFPLSGDYRTAPLWISTSGLGVYWLHIRLDNAPKYYAHGPYRTP